jgi:hypothetical protein
MGGVLQVCQGIGDISGQQIEVYVGRIVRVKRFEPEPLPPAGRIGVQRSDDHGPAGSIYVQLGGGSQDVLEHLGAKAKLGHVNLGSRSADQKRWNLLWGALLKRLGLADRSMAVIDKVA